MIKKLEKNVKTFAEMENILKSAENEYNKDQLKEIKRKYDYTLDVLEKNKEAEM